VPYRVGFALVLPLAVLASDAKAGPDRATLKQRCGSDYTTYCGDLAPDGPEVRACFQENMANLSAACRAEIGRQAKGGRKG
jgi:hypothetical protein